MMKTGLIRSVLDGVQRYCALQREMAEREIELARRAQDRLDNRQAQNHRASSPAQDRLDSSRVQDRPDGGKRRDELAFSPVATAWDEWERRHAS
jgi:hypothetical protein